MYVEKQDKEKHELAFMHPQIFHPFQSADIDFEASALFL